MLATTLITASRELQGIPKISTRCPSEPPICPSIRTRRSQLQLFRARMPTRRISSGRTRASVRSRRIRRHSGIRITRSEVSVNRRYSHGFSIGARLYPRALARGQHHKHPVSTIRIPPVCRYFGLVRQRTTNCLVTPDAVPNFLKVNTTWNIPGITSRGTFLHVITGDWQVSGVLTAQSGGAYSAGFSYQNGNGSAVGLTGSSPDFNARAVVNLSQIGSGCSGNQFAQFNTAAVTGPTYGSIGEESGQLYLRGCATQIVDTAIVRKFHFWKFKESRTFEFRTDIFNALNAAFITGRNSSITLNNPTNQVIQNAEFDGSGNILSGKSLPQNAGFGAATSGSTARNLQLEVRIAF